ncbi:MAG: DUF1549 domain-containing protein, partial [Planctomycetales bacterium]|nr:DUF1549 domain-containing protein [Planctomycetales bacterium]
MCRRVISAVLLISSLQGHSLALANEDQSGELLFEERIRPVLVRECYACHSTRLDAPEGGLLLDSRDGVRNGGDSGAAVSPAHPEQSLLISALRHETLKMPPGGKLPDQVIHDFEQWVSLGAFDPRTGQPEGRIAAKETHWAFQPIGRAPPPGVGNAAWPRNDIDRFVLKRLEEANLSPADRADPRALARRLSYDLTGLPPTAEELEAVVSDAAEDRYAKLIDRLLASPRFGEHWARLWLDLARYADTRGYNFQADREYKGAYKYRDWVIASFNGDLPYDEFVRRQLVSDLTESTDDDPASGFLTLGFRFLNNPHDIIDDRIDLVTRGLLGMTVACARCHDH